MAASKDVFHPRTRMGYKAFVHAVIAAAVAQQDAYEYAAKRWGDNEYNSALNLLTKSEVGALTSATPAAAIDGADDGFFKINETVNLFGRVPNFRRVNFNVRQITMSGGAHGYWVGQRSPIPLSKPALIGSSLPRKKVAALMVATLESLLDPRSENRLESDLVRAVGASIDEAFLDSSNDGSAEVPASPLSGVTPIVSVDPLFDVSALVDAFAGDLAEAIFITDSRTATELALWRDANGAFPFRNVGPRGGEILGIPLLVTPGSPVTSDGGQIALIDPSSIAYAFDSIEVSRATHATIAMADDPESPTLEQVSMFQTESVALKSVSNINWELQREGAAVFVNNINYRAS